MLPAPISTTAKGTQLEIAFSEWMVDNGYHDVVLAQGQPIAYLGGDYKPDILASRHEYFWIALKVIGSGCCIAAIFLAVIKPIFFQAHPGYILLLLSMGGPLFIAGGIRRRSRYWVECKNWEKPIDRTVIQNLYVCMIVAKHKKGGIWRGILVSRTAFRREVLELASHLNIQCYQGQKNNFERVYCTDREPDLFEPYA